MHVINQEVCLLGVLVFEGTVATWLQRMIQNEPRLAPCLPHIVSERGPEESIVEAIQDNRIIEICANY